MGQLLIINNIYSHSLCYLGSSSSPPNSSASLVVACPKTSFAGIELSVPFKLPPSPHVVLEDSLPFGVQSVWTVGLEALVDSDCSLDMISDGFGRALR